MGRWCRLSLVLDYSRRDWLPSGELEVDLTILKDALPGFLEVVESHGPSSLATEARELSETDDQILAERLMTYWHNPSDIQFFEKAFLQPYLRWLAQTGARPLGREVP